jgi:hypothetical protein
MDRTQLPDLEDMLSAGMGLTETLAFWNEMMNSLTLIGCPFGETI